MSVRLWAVAMAKDEGDIVYKTLCHLASNGVDGIVIANNLSKDNTQEEIEKAKKHIEEAIPGIQIIVLEDNVVQYTQSEKMSNLAEMARGHGAEWIIPFDVDEIWYSPNSTLKEAINTINDENYDVYRVLYTNHSITKNDPVNKHPFESMGYKWSMPTNHKSCFRFRSGDSKVKISNGNHFVQHNGWDIGQHVKVAIDDYGFDRVIFGPQLVAIRHFQWRSLDQFIQKILKSYESCKALDSFHDLYYGAAWKEHFEIYESKGLDGLKEFFYSNIYVSENIDSLIFDPAPIGGLQ